MNINDQMIQLYKKDINLGIEILRSYLSFSVVVIHIFNIKNKKNNIIAEFIFHCHYFYVPTFFFISFYFSFTIFNSKNINKIKERFLRILIPYITWPIFIWVRDIVINFKETKFGIILFKSIFMQLLTGYDFYQVFWFQFDLIIITIIFTIIFFIFNKYSLIILRILGIIGFIINNYYEKKLEKYKQIGSIKPLIQSFIYSITGLNFGSFFKPNKTKNIKYVAYLLIIPLIFLIIKYRILITYYKFLKIIIVDLLVISIFLLFSLLPLDLIQNNIIKKIIKQLTSYTGGIYYIHFIVRKIFKRYKIFIIGNIQSCILIYLVSYFICFIGSTIFLKTKAKYLSI